MSPQYLKLEAELLQGISQAEDKKLFLRSLIRQLNEDSAHPLNSLEPDEKNQLLEKLILALTGKPLTHTQEEQLKARAKIITQNSTSGNGFSSFLDFLKDIILAII